MTETYDTEEDVMITPYSEKQILDSFSSDIAMDSIEQQINRLLEEDYKNSNDLFAPILERYKFLKTKYVEQDELLEKLEDTMLNMAETIQNKIQEALDFEIFFTDSLLNEDKIHMIHMIYRFFICDINFGMESLLYNYFIKNIEQFPQLEINKKDQTYLEMKDTINKKYINQIYNAITNLESIKDFKFVAEDIFELMIEDDELMISNYWIDNIFIDNFMCEITYGEKFISNVIDWVLDCPEIMYKVQLRLLKEYSNKS